MSVMHSKDICMKDVKSDLAMCVSLFSACCIVCLMFIIAESCKV